METYLKIVTGRPRPVLAVLVLLAALAALPLLRPGLRMDPNPYLLNAGHPSMVAFADFQATYTGSNESVLVMLRHPASIYNAGTLRRLAELTTAFERMSLLDAGAAEALAALLPALRGEARGQLEQVLQGGLDGSDLEGVQNVLETLSAEGPVPPALGAALHTALLKLLPVKKVTSLANAEHIAAHEDELVVGPLYEDVPADAAGLAALRRAAEGNELFRQLLVSRDGRSTGSLIETYVPVERTDLMGLLQQRVEEILAAHPGAEQAYVSGIPILSATIQRVIQQDNETFFPFVFGIVLLILLLFFRSAAGVLLPIAVVVLSVLMTLGLMAAFHVPLNNISAALPVFLITIGVADGIHLVSEFRDHRRRGQARREATVATMRHLAMPVIMTSVTTMVGFSTLAYTEIKYIKHFGIFVTAGVFIAMAISLTFVPAALALTRKRATAQAPLQNEAHRAGPGGLIQRLDAGVLGLLVGISQFAVRRNRLVLGLTLLLLAVAAYGMTRVRAENNFINYLRQDLPVVQASQALDREMAGSNVLHVVMSAPADEEAPFKQPRYLALAEELQTYLNGFSYVGKTLSLVDVLKRLNLVLHDNDPAYNRLPAEQEWVQAGASGGGTAGNNPAGRVQVAGRDLVAQVLLLYENGGGENLSDFTDTAFSTLVINVRLTTQSTADLDLLLAQVAGHAAAHLPPGVSARLVGAAELMSTTNREVVSTQITSLGFSLLLVFLLLLVEFRSLAKGLLGILPLVVTVLVNFGVMGLLGFELNIGTAIISSVVSGIGVDLALQYLSRLQLELERRADKRAAFAATMRASGKAITANAFTVALGFLALSFSSMLPLRQVGWMISQTLLFSAVTTLVLLPAAATFFMPRFLRTAGSGRAAAGEAAAQPDA